MVEVGLIALSLVAIFVGCFNLNSPFGLFFVFVGAGTVWQILTGG